eukprot:Nitzschia sp. Nitz4//scaffold322_size40381//33375//35485//NITZ4_007567-RA/size40381-augustus-gene-0.58-mRNA-1//-1//CDS//3329547848//2686//frame0
MAGNDKAALVVGLSLPQKTPDASEVLKLARQDGYDFVTTVLSSTKDPRPDVTALVGRWWRTSIVGLVEETLDPHEMLQKLPTQLDWATHMGIPAVILPPPTTSTLAEYARVLQSMALQAQLSNLQLWIQVPLQKQALQEYDQLLRLCDGLANIGMMLVMDPMTTSNSTASAVASQLVLLHKAIGAQLKAVCFPTDVFLTNKMGYPALPKSHQLIFTQLLKRVGRTVRVLVSGPSKHKVHDASAEGVGATACLPYLQYIRHVRDRDEVCAMLDSEQASLEQPYLDNLQRPLQPLKDHLEFSMYETFEKDPIKYTMYEEAVFQALRDGLGPTPTSVQKLVVIAVAGAGRGPLVMRAINAFKRLLCPPSSVVLKVYAVEKNPSAIVYLQSMAKYNEEWVGVVKVVQADARTLVPAMLDGNKIDIVVSELLGSFGDNELSPECLDPLLAGPCCKATTISIPQEYTSFLAPVSSVRLHTDARQQAQIPGEGAQPVGIQRAMETSYVVRTHAASQTHAEKECWVFHHPPKSLSMERTVHLDFAPDPTFAATSGCGYGPIDAPLDAVIGELTESPGPITIHGFLGSFTAILYARGENVVKISIAPHEFSEDMFSWFPVYFPFHEPLCVPADAHVGVSVWRKTADQRVWYEWCANVHRNGEVMTVTPIHNPNGRSSHVSM